MLRKGMTIEEAAREWVKEFNAYPQDMIQTLMEVNPDDWCEATMPCIGDNIECYLPVTTPEGKVEDIYEDGDGNIKYKLRLDDDTFVDCEIEDFNVLYEYVLPMWGTMWSFDDITDNEWLELRDGIQAMSECGFRIYEHEEWGYFFGIDGAGYSFYDEHWIPLYKARGLRWHDGKEEEDDGQTPTEG